MLIEISTQINLLATDSSLIWLSDGNGYNISFDKDFLTSTHSPFTLFDMPEIIQNGVIIDPDGLYEINRISETQTIIKKLVAGTQTIDIIWPGVIGDSIIGQDFIIS